jgi:hypothetical protein
MRISIPFCCYRTSSDFTISAVQTPQLCVTEVLPTVDILAIGILSLITWY